MSIEYYIARRSRLSFDVVKFDGHELPCAHYHVKYDESTHSGRCDCLGFRHTGQQDKHIQLVKDWLENGTTPIVC